ncbi:MAG TPA: translocation/assembly module TamB domain-containing protein [Pyrinomonadaceae bacterium]|nr:translocation/assembly module TamB domain-containing protein [Chloracidobacterium sp.]MBP9935557.1 translocation/assembly module TamB domain-containing protein [Pyrinomonadaceae bacterium]MBK7801159.1 translocation/assembly module TamB domain-containing protein [Chloracidobacterium sp.]MBL0241463.1 translocation/assembly module TamB domain-containing protein [Chloracidobacterium sp.]HQX54441.1 translocation/assembly module TamB domain-containing protein [Pyrinomonadaceae bacterium]
MADDKIENQPSENTGDDGNVAPVRRSLFGRRRVLAIFGAAALALVVVGITIFVLYRVGVFDGYIKGQLTSKLDQIGIDFEPESFRVTASPMTLEMRNATFKDKVSGEKLFFVRDLRLGMTVLDLLAWRLTRDISLESSDVSGAEVWVKFDENGRSNFSNLKFIEDERGSSVNFRYDSVKVNITDSVIHFGDASRRIAGDAKDLTVSFAPDAASAGADAESKRYNFDIFAKDSNFAYEDRRIQNIDLRAIGIADRHGAEINDLRVNTPVGQASLTGIIRDWADPNYELQIESTLDITQISNFVSPGSALRGVGNFKGKVTGHGEAYRVEGNADSQAIRAGGVYLRAANVAATVEGTNANYTANGTAVAEMLTFEDFQVDFPKLTGNVRGTGTDFRWVGELQAIAAKSPTLSLGGLFLSDAMAEYKDRQFRAEVGNGRAQRFSIGDTELLDLRARQLKLKLIDGGVDISSPNVAAKSYVTEDYRLNGVTSSGVEVKSVTGRTQVEVNGVRSETAETKAAKLKNVSADRLSIDVRKGNVGLTATDLKASRIDASGTIVEGIETPLATLEDTAAGTVIYSDKLRVARLETDSAVLGSLNIAGVRLTIRNGTLEGRSGDVDAGNISLKKTKSLSDGGELNAVKINRPVFILERSGRYRATADMSIGGGMVGSVALGSATAKVDINNDRALLDQLNARVMNGDVVGNVTVALNSRTQSRVDAVFSSLDLSKLAALQSGRVIPIEGSTNGSVALTFDGTDISTASGKVDASITANAGTAERGMVPVNGVVELTALRGLFDISKARLFTDKSELTATGRFDLRAEESNLALQVNSSDAAEIKRLFEVTGAAPDVEQELNDLEVDVAGRMSFEGRLTGNLYSPDVDGKASIELVSMRGRQLGRLSADIAVSEDVFRLNNGKLAESGGGTADFSLIVPFGTANSVEILAKLNGINTGNLLAALPITLPERFRDLNGTTSGMVDIKGLPDKAEGSIDLASKNGVVAGQNFDDLKAKAVFRGTQIDLETGEIRVGNGSLTAKGMYDRQSKDFDLDLVGREIPLQLLLAALPKNDNIPSITGAVDLAGKALGKSDTPSSYKIELTGGARGVNIGDSPFGDVLINAKTENAVLTASLMANLEGRQQVIDASVRFDRDELPFSVSTVFDQSPLAPYLAFVPQLKGVPITGTGTGRIEFGGNLREQNDKGEFVYTGSRLSGTAAFTQLAMTVQENPLAAVEPIMIRFNTREVVFENAKFAGGGSNMTISGHKALIDTGVNDLSVDGRINLTLLNLATTDIFFAGFADVAVRYSGPNQTARLSGTAQTENAAIATFIGSDRLTFDRVKTRVIFTSNQAEIESASGYLGGGKFSGTGGAVLSGLSVKAFRVNVNGDSVTVPIPNDFLTTGDARLEITGIRRTDKENLQITIGGRVFAKRSLYSQDIDLANVVGARRDTSLSTGPSTVSAPRFDLIIEGRDALIVRNNIADLTASVSLALTGDANNPQLSGRITANSGTLFYRKDRYDVQRGVLEFPPNTEIDPIINLQAETEIGGYQIFVNLAGPLNDTELLTATLRSSPALPQADVVSLITTGALSNTAGGIPTLAQTGINTAAEILTDSIINNPARRATDKLFGLNVFEIDPIISGQQLDPSARLTVGRQINNNLRVTYSTNLSQDQNQVLALEYRVSNKLSFVAQYEQRSLSNVTRTRDNFSFEIRFRKRF